MCVCEKESASTRVSRISLECDGENIVSQRNAKENEHGGPMIPQGGGTRTSGGTRGRPCVRSQTHGTNAETAWTRLQSSLTPAMRRTTHAGNGGKWIVMQVVWLEKQNRLDNPDNSS
mmetsp:Transcript_51878/g.135368  ORF Transcript_51878/g.135368 Transcript_51878/m.135368 type:complete len:117 (+) Transcript_51878:1404-1754(+)